MPEYRPLHKRIRDRIANVSIDIITRHVAPRDYQDTFETFMSLGRRAYIQLIEQAQEESSGASPAPVRAAGEGYL